MSRSSSEQHTYSLISVEKASEPEAKTLPNYEVEMVDKAEESLATEEVGETKETAATGETAAAGTAETEKTACVEVAKKTGGSQGDRYESALDNLTEDDLKISAPLENVHKIIIAVLIVGLVVFGLYFVLFM